MPWEEKVGKGETVVCDDCCAPSLCLREPGCFTESKPRPLGASCCGAERGSALLPLHTEQCQLLTLFLLPWQTRCPGLHRWCLPQVCHG